MKQNINEWTQLAAARMMDKARKSPNQIEKIGAASFIAMIGHEGYGLGGPLMAITCDLPTPIDCDCEGCIDSRNERITRSALFVPCRSCKRTPVPRNRKSGRCVGCGG